MVLSAELYNDILENLTTESSVRGQERRGKGRVGLRCTLEITPVSLSDAAGKPMIVWVRDLSINGIGFVTSSQLKEELEFIAHFTRLGTLPLAVVYRVRHCKRLTRDLFSIGAELQRVIPDDPAEAAAAAVAAALAGNN